MTVLIDFRTECTRIKHWVCISKVAGREPVILKSSTKHMPVDYIKDTIYNIKEQKTILTVKII